MPATRADENVWLVAETRRQIEDCTAAEDAINEARRRLVWSPELFRELNAVQRQVVKKKNALVSVYARKKRSNR